MRLLNTATLRLESFSADAPPYAILSHRWTEDELLFHDVQEDDWQTTISTPGAEKTKRACQQALQDGLSYIWIDTCCIDKSSSTELSEAINSMFIYYNEAVACYAYLVDVGEEQGSFEQSLWFKRGWTLQELIAPEVLIFYNTHWTRMGDRNDMAPIICEITGVHTKVLSREQPTIALSCDRIQLSRTNERGTQLRIILSSYSVAARLSWAAERHTTRKEDVAYSLLGLFDVNMPLLYGEGEQAFKRFLQEVVRKIGDPSVLLSTGDSTSFYHSPMNYAGRGDVVWLEATEPAGSSVSVAKSGGLAIEAQAAPCNIRDRRRGNVVEGENVAVVLDCVVSGSHTRYALIFRRCRLHNVYEQWRELPFFELDCRQSGQIESIPTKRPNYSPMARSLEPHPYYSVSFVEDFLEQTRLEVAFTETYRVARRKAQLIADPIVQPPGMHYTLRNLGLVTNLPQDKHDLGVFVVEDGQLNRFLLLWGFPLPEELKPIHNRLSFGVDRQQDLKPWCRVLSVENPLHGVPKADAPLMGEADLRFTIRDSVEIRSELGEAQLQTMIKGFRARCDTSRSVDLGDVSISLSLRTQRFLGITSYSLFVRLFPGSGDKPESRLQSPRLQAQPGAGAAGATNSSASPPKEENRWRKLKARSGF